MKTATLPRDEILKTMAAEAVKQQHHLRETVRDLTLKALQARELNLKQIDGVVGSIAQGINAGTAANSEDMKNVSQMHSRAWTMPSSRLSKPTKLPYKN